MQPTPTGTGHEERGPVVGRLRDRPLLVLLVVLAQLVILQLVLRTPYLGDDAPNQTIVGYAQAQGQTLLEFIWQLTLNQYSGMGRFMPIGLAQNYLLNGLLHERVVYKLILVVLTSASTLALARTLISVRIPVAVALLGAGLAAPLWQLHAYHDPLVSYAGITQVVLMLACFATLCHLRWLRGGSAWWGAGTVVLLLSANLVYEAGFLMVGMVVGATLAVGGRLRTLVPAVAATGAAVLFAATKRPADGQYSMSLAVGPYATTLAKQLAAALPGASWLDPIGAKIRAPTAPASAWMRGGLVGLLLFPVIRAALRARPLVAGGGVRRPLGLLIMLGTPTVLPAALVAFASRYQEEIRWGVGYLPVSLTVAAFASSAAILIWWVARRTSPQIVGAFTVAGVVIGVWASTSASMRIVSADFGYAQSQDQLRSLAHHGAFNEIPTSTTILFDQDNFRPPSGVWLPGYGYSPSNWLYVQANHRRWPSFPVPAGALGALCTNTFGDAIGPPCPRITGPVMWARTGRSFEQQRWLLLTPAPQPRAKDVLGELPAAGPATLFYPADRTPPPVMYLVDPAAPPVTTAALRRLPGDAGGWARYAVPVPRGALSGTGTVR